MPVNQDKHDTVRCWMVENNVIILEINGRENILSLEGAKVLNSALNETLKSHERVIDLNRQITVLNHELKMALSQVGPGKEKGK